MTSCPPLRLDAKLPRVHERLEAPLEVPKQRHTRLGRRLRLAQLLEPRARVVECLREGPALREDLVDVLAEPLELAAELLVDRGLLVELGLYVVGFGGEIAQFGVAILRRALRGRDLLLEGQDLTLVFLLPGVGVGLGLDGVCHAPVVRHLRHACGRAERRKEDQVAKGAHARASYSHAGRSTTSARVPPTTTC